MTRCRIVIAEQQIPLIVDRLAEQISTDYEGQDITLVGIMKGSIIFIADLMRALERKSRIACIRLDLIGYGSYGDKQQPGDLRLLFDTSHPRAGKHVIIVEDVADTLTTVRTARAHLYTNKTEEKRPKSIAICAFISKPDKSQHQDVELKYVGIELREAGFLIGYGMYNQGEKRGLPFVARLID